MFLSALFKLTAAQNHVNIHFRMNDCKMFRSKCVSVHLMNFCGLRCLREFVDFVISACLLLYLGPEFLVLFLTDELSYQRMRHNIAIPDTTTQVWMSDIKQWTTFANFISYFLSFTPIFWECICMNRLRCLVYTWSLFYYVSLNPSLHTLYVSSVFKNAYGHSTGCSGSSLNVPHSIPVPNINWYSLALFLSSVLSAQLSTPFQLTCRCSGALLTCRFHTLYGSSTGKMP